MPEPLGELGRRLIWDWQDVAAWATKEGRLDAGNETVRQVAAPWRSQPRGAMRLVIDDILQWGRAATESCHVRVWAPPAGSAEPQVVLLGDLEDSRRTVTNFAEDVATAVAARLLGPNWAQALIYQYRPAGPLDDEDFFARLTFAITPLSALRRLSARVTSDQRRLGKQISEPRWRRTVVDELEHLTGDVPQVWATGTYTRQLVARHLVHPQRRLQLEWDPGQARALTIALERLTQPMTALGAAAVDVLTVPQRKALRRALAQEALAAAELARDDVATAPVEAVFELVNPQLPSHVPLERLAQEHADPTREGHHLWDALCSLRNVLMHADGFPLGPATARAAQLLVPGNRGGLVELHWSESGLEDLDDPRQGWGQYLALPSDLVDAGPHGFTDDDLFTLVLTTVAVHLQSRWHDWFWHDVPIFRPSPVMDATGTFARRYLSGLKFHEPREADHERMRRLANSADVAKVATDGDGWLVGIPSDGGWFVCEYPVGGATDPSLQLATIRADRSSREGDSPVFVDDGEALHLLPASPLRWHLNSFAWGYGGGGPTNLAGAVYDLLLRADPSLKHEADKVKDFAGDLVGGPRTPAWPINDLLVGVAAHRVRS